MSKKRSRLIWNIAVAGVIAAIIAITYTEYAADLARRAYHVPVTLADVLVFIRRNDLFFFLVPLPFLLACFYSVRELFYDQFVIRFGNTKTVWKLQLRELAKLSLLYSFLFNAAGIAFGLRFTNLLYNWDQKQSLCCMIKNTMVKVEPVFILLGSFALLCLYLMLYSVAFFTLIWKLSSPIGALLLCAALIALDRVAVASELRIFPSELLSNDYLKWNPRMLLRILIVSAGIALLCQLGKMAAQKKEFL